MDKLAPGERYLTAEKSRAFWKEVISEALAQRNELLGHLIKKPLRDQEIRDHLGDVIEGLLDKRISFPNRKPKRDLEDRRIALAARVREVEKEKGWKRRAVVDFVAERMRCSKSTVWAAWREFGPTLMAAEIIREQHDLDAIFDRLFRNNEGKSGEPQFGRATEEEIKILNSFSEEIDIQRSLRRRKDRSK